MSRAATFDLSCDNNISPVIPIHDNDGPARIVKQFLATSAHCFLDLSLTQ